MHLVDVDVSLNHNRPSVSEDIKKKIFLLLSHKHGTFFGWTPTNFKEIPNKGYTVLGTSLPSTSPVLHMYCTQQLQNVCLNKREQALWKLEKVICRDTIKLFAQAGKCQFHTVKIYCGNKKCNLWTIKNGFHSEKWAVNNIDCRHQP